MKLCLSLAQTSSESGLQPAEGSCKNHSSFSHPLYLFFRPCFSSTMNTSFILNSLLFTVRFFTSVCVNSCIRRDPGHVQGGQICKRRDHSRQQMVSLRWIDRRTARWMKKQITVSVCVCRSLQEDAQQPMEPIAEENIEMPEAQTDAESRLLRYVVQNTQYTRSEHKQAYKRTLMICLVTPKKLVNQRFGRSTPSHKTCTKQEQCRLFTLWI